MGDITIYEDGPLGLYFRKIRHGEPTAEFRLVTRIGDVETVSAPLSDVHLGILAANTCGSYFERTGRLVWPMTNERIVKQASAYDPTTQPFDEPFRHVDAGPPAIGNDEAPHVMSALNEASRPIGMRVRRRVV